MLVMNLLLVDDAPFVKSDSISMNCHGRGVEDTLT